MPEWSTLGIMAGKSMFGRDGNDLEPEAPVSSLAAAEGFAMSFVDNVSSCASSCALYRGPV